MLGVSVGKFKRDLRPLRGGFFCVLVKKITVDLYSNADYCQKFFWGCVDVYQIHLKAQPHPAHVHAPAASLGLS